MFLFLRPKYVKRAKLYIREAQKRVHYNRDRWSDVTVADFDAQIAKLKKAVREHDKAAVTEAEHALEQLCEVHCPTDKHAWISENTEVILVAIIVALGIRTFFLQPFTIPTSSMEPTLFGITGRETEEGPPNILMRILDFAWNGRTWHEEVALADETITEVKEVKRGGLRRVMTYTRVETDQGNTYWINETVNPVQQTFKLSAGVRLKKGQTFVRGFTDTGDHIFVDKVSYHFRKPRAGEVFVFDTRTLATIERRNNPSSNTQYYIKRLVAGPGDTLQVMPPQLLINGKIAEGTGYERVMRGTIENPVEGYRGYSNQTAGGFQFPLLGDPRAKFTVPERHYFAMGDNSYFSSDSRDWGAAPEENLMGTGFFVYWPFSRDRGGRWGLVR